MSPINILLNALPTRYYNRGQGKFQAVCPSHDDGSPSLSITEVQDGRVLMHCHGGCAIESVLDACGLTMADLYPENHRRYKSLMSFLYTKPDTELADYVVTYAEHDMRNGKLMSRRDMETYKRAFLDGGQER